MTGEAPIFSRTRKPIILAALFLLLPLHAFADAERTLVTKFASVRYADEQDLFGFFWRISGKRLALTAGRDLVKDRVDELVERVEQLLEMYPPDFHFSISLDGSVLHGSAAEYSHKIRTIFVTRDRVTDGVLAHEIAHAVISVYFPVPPPQRAQEILAQYVDKHLYEEPL